MSRAMEEEQTAKRISSVSGLSHVSMGKSSGQFYIPSALIWTELEQILYIFQGHDTSQKEQLPGTTTESLYF